MKINQNKIHFKHARGITLVEILLVISLLVILLSFAIPSMGGAAAKAEMTATVENVQHSIQSARNMARMLGMDDYPFVMVRHPIGSLNAQEVSGRAAAAYAQSLPILQD